MLLLAFSVPCSSKLRGKQRIDSLEKELSIHQHSDDTIKADILIYLSDTYRNFDPEKANEFGLQALALSKKLSWKPGIGYAYNTVGMNYEAISDYETALKNLYEGRKIFEEIHQSDGLALILNDIGSIYNSQGEYAKALHVFNLVLEITKQSGNKKRMASAISKLGNLHIYQGDYDKALKYYEEAIEIFRELDDTSSLINNLINTGSVYNYRGDYTQALHYYFSALKMLDKIVDRGTQASLLSNIGSVYAIKYETDKAKEYYFKALKLYNENKDIKGKASVLGNLGALYNEEKNYEKAMEYYIRSLETCREIDDKEGIAANLENMSDIYLLQEKYLSAITYATNAVQINEQIGDKTQLASSLLVLGKTYLALYDDTTGKVREILIHRNIDGQLVTPIISNEKSSLIRNAITNLEKGLSVALTVGAPHTLVSYYSYLARAHTVTGNYKMALEYYKQEIALKEAGFKEENTFLKSKLEHEYDLKKHTDSLHNIEKEHVTKLKLQKQRLYTAAGAIGMILLAFILFFAYKANKLLSREKKRSETLLLNILPAEIAAELKDNGTATARMFDDVTIMFTDFVSFTQATEQIPPQQLVAELDTCFKAFDEIITRHNMEKIKTIGDAYLAVCGLPMPVANHATNVINAAMEIRDFMLTRYANHGSNTFEIRIGVHTGSVVAGIVGIKKFAYDIWGDAVNTAARMEQNSESGRINVSEATYVLVQHQFPFHYRGEIDVKNKGAIKMYFVQ